MTTKDYELIVIPSDSEIDLLLRSKSTNLSDIQAAKIVADWHRYYQCSNNYLYIDIIDLYMCLCNNYNYNLINIKFI